MQRGRVILHAGSSKTGTTSLQENVFARLPDTLFLGKPYPHLRNGKPVNYSHQESKLIQKAILLIVREPNDPHTEIRAVRAIIDRMRKTSPLIIHSNEGLSNNKYVPFRTIANRLRAAFGPADLMFTVRSQTTALPSLYLHEMRTIEHVEFSEWLANALAEPKRKSHPEGSLEQYLYHSMIEEFRAEFDGRIGILLFENLSADLPLYSRQLADFLDMEFDTVAKLIAGPSRNVAKTKAWYRFRRFYEKARTSASALRLVDKTPAVQWIKHRVSNVLAAKPGLQPMRVKLSESERRLIDDYFGQDNRSLAAAFGLDLQSHAWPGSGNAPRHESGDIVRPNSPASF